MINFDDIKKTYDSSDNFILDLEYKERQEENKRINDEIVMEVIDTLDYGRPEIKLFKEPMAKFYALMILIRNSNSILLKRVFREVISRYGYSTASELIVAMQLTDNYFKKEISLKDLTIFIKESLTISSITANQHKNVTLYTTNGQIDLTPGFSQLKMQEYKPEIRRKFCHQMTSLGLEIFPELFGAYYYIPQIFKGYIEHSVLINHQNNMVYDLANNIAVSLNDWQKYYPHPSFMISGKEFQELNKQTYETYGTNINMVEIEQIRRRKLK